jgi:hypothetical protein
MARRIIIGIIAPAVIGGGLASTAAASTVRLELDQGSAFAILGHSCGGIQEKVYVRGFAPNGYPQGNVEMSTKCGGSGRGGGYKTTTYTGTASVVWTWFGETRSYGALEGPLEAIEATDEYGDHVYNVGTAAYLETGNPPLRPPAAPTNVAASVGLYECGEGCEYLRMTVSWAEAQETEGLVKYSTVTATPVGSSAPVLATTTSSNYFRYADLSPVEPNTTYRITVTNTDAEGTSEPSTPIEITSPNSDGEAEKERNTVETCALNHGKIHLTPGLTETPAIQSITVKGEMSECGGPLGFEAGKYTAHLVTTEEVTCSALSSASLEGTQAQSLSVKWLPLEEGTSKGSLVLPLSEVPLTGMTGTMVGGPFLTATSLNAESVSESFKGAALCGVPQGKEQLVKPVKAGLFSTSEVVFG